MKRIYKVSYEQKFTGIGEWMPDHKNVLANGDATNAIRIAKRSALKEGFDDEKGVWRRCTKFRFTEIEVVAEAELP